ERNGRCAPRGRSGQRRRGSARAPGRRRRAASRRWARDHGTGSARGARGPEWQQDHRRHWSRTLSFWPWQRHPQGRIAGRIVTRRMLYSIELERDMRDHDVVIAGGGLTGLILARTLVGVFGPQMRIAILDAVE